MHQSRTIPKYSFLPSSPRVLAGAQPGDRAQTKMASTARKQYAKQLSDHTEIVHLYKNLSDNFFQAKPACFSLCQLRLKKKKDENLHSLLEMIKKASELTTTENYALSVYNLSMVIYKALQQVSNSDT